jgi:ADP-heptose:LPS heptosyltransferase
MDIVLLRLDRIGDFLLGVPAYRALRRARPKDRITAVVSPRVKDLAEACPYFDEVFLFEAAWLEPDRGILDRWRSALRLIRFLRSLRADWVLDFRDMSRMDPLVTGLSGARLRVGFDLGLPSRLFLNRAVPCPARDTHQLERNLLLLKALGVSGDGTALEVWTDERDRKTALEHLPRQEALPGTPRVAVHVGAAAPSKQWKAEDLSTLVQEAMSQFQAEVLLMGGAEDLDTAREVMEGLKGPVVNLVGKITLRQAAALLRTCAAFVGGDSGLGHLAAACGIPVVSLFSAANEPEVWKPRGERVRVLTSRPDCSPCKSHRCRRTDGYFCMDDIRVEDVLEALRGFL